ncbi:nucleic acid-binding protein [Psychrobacillus glaciei]|uniref:Nucleic acid-binding protein n=1 Tax=Psychrobacillus glaciei TaxID=2283160 RepID=A0A5J6SS00_9BACI|nr:nucleic acid-binding protein [Psychrobacillus glaciei]QFF98957.1 nucleic acid-binding protein [Psychrobacillus glaciei]
MSKVCNQCQSEMTEGCDVLVEGVMYGIKVKKRRRGLFKSISAKPKAAVCPNCGYVALYINNYEEFSD